MEIVSNPLKLDPGFRSACLSLKIKKIDQNPKS